MARRSFSGFRSGFPATVISNEFFTQLLPEIVQPAELIVSVYLFFALGRQRGWYRAVSYRALAAERPLVQSLAHLPGGAEQALRDGLSLALARGTILSMQSVESAPPVYMLNTEASRRRLAEGETIEDDSSDSIAVAVPLQPDIFRLYEENIGSLPPILIEELEEAERTFPSAWVEAAFREASANNRRNWRYIHRILERWKIEGPDYETPGRRPAASDAGKRRTIGGPYRRVIDRRQSQGT